MEKLNKSYYIIMAKINNNEELVIDLMNFSPYGSVGQMFVMDALQKQAKKVANLTDEQVAKLNEGNPIVNMESWRGVARDIQIRIDHFYNRKV